MAVLAVGLVGSAIGATFGYAAVGWAVGVYVGQQLFGPKPPDMEGPRLNDLTITSSAYGSIIPIGYGTVRLAGNIIWSAGLKETKHKESTGGKGGGGGSYTTYTYSASFALALSEGKAEDLLRIWADGKLIYDKTVPQQVIDVANAAEGPITSVAITSGNKSGGVNFRFYKGTEYQLPDSLIMSHEGADIPAHRGLCYIVFEDLQLADYGNRIPNITCEVAYKAIDYTVPDVHDVVRTELANEAFWDFVREISENSWAFNIQAMRAMDVKYVGPQTQLAEYPYITTYGDTHVVYYMAAIEAVKDTVTNVYGVMLVKIDAATGQVLQTAYHKIDSYPGSYGFALRDNRIYLLEYRAANTFAPIEFDTDTLRRVSTTFTEEDNTVLVTLPGSSGNWKASIMTTDRGYAVLYHYHSVFGSPLNRQLQYIETWSLVGIRTGYAYFDYYEPKEGHTGTPLPGMYNETFPNINWEGASGQSLTSVTRLWDLVLVANLVTTDTTPIDYFIVFYVVDPMNGRNVVSSRIDITSVVSDDTAQLIIGSIRYLEYDNSVIVQLYGDAVGGVEHYVKIKMQDDFMYTYDKSGTIEWVKTSADISSDTIDWIFPSINAFSLYGIPSTYTAVKHPELIYTPSEDTRVFNFDTAEDSLIGWTDPRGSTISYSLYHSKGMNAQFHFVDADYGVIWQWPNPPDGGTIDFSNLLFTRLQYRGDPIVSPPKTTLADIVRDICRRVDLDPVDDIYVDELESALVYGYTISQQSPARAMIEQLTIAYQFDFLERDYKLVGQFKNSTPVAELSYKDFSVLDQETGSIIRETRVQEVELPMRVEVRYRDLDNDYQSNVQISSRSQQPIPTMESVQVSSIDIPIVHTATYMKQLAEQLLYSTWINRTTYDGSTSWRWAKLDPADTVLITLVDGTILTARILRSEFAGDLVINLSAVSNDEALYVPSNTMADSGLGVPNQFVPVIAPSILIILDTPLLRDIDSLSRERHRLYYTVAGTRDAWPGAGVLVSYDNAEYNVIDQLQTECSWGIVNNALNDTDTPFMTDYESRLTVNVLRGADSLESVSREQMLTESRNAAAIIKADGGVEIIQFQNVTENVDGTYTLDTFFRGRRGTDVFVNGHEVYQKIVFLDLETIQNTELALSERNMTKYYKAVTYGMLLDGADSVEYAHSGRDLMPYAPVHEQAAISGSDIDITWVRRTRINGFLRDYTDEVPLEEDSEEYELEIYDSPGGTLLRTYTGITSPTYTYPNADIITDFGSIPDTLTIKVYQISAQVGRGFSREVTVTVT